MKWKLALVLGAAAAILLYVMYQGFGKDPHEVPFMLKGKPAPDFTLKRLDTGEVVKLSQLKGRPVVLNFWASWCGPCRFEHPVLRWGATALADRAQFYGVIFEDTLDNAKDALGPDATNAALPQLVDPQSQVAVDYGVAGVPETYFIDSNGIIRNKYAGPLDQRMLINFVNALGQPAPSPPAGQL